MNPLDPHARDKKPTPTSELLSVKKAAKQEFRSITGIEGFGIGDRTLKVYVIDATVSAHLPGCFRGVPVECIISGAIVAESRSLLEGRCNARRA